jgi:hypothetical protein
MLVGDVIGFLIQRGEMLPAVGDTSLVTVKDGQTGMALSIFQGEHYLAELSSKIGTARMEGLPAMSRGQCEVAIRVEYDENGILQFSAEETRSKTIIHAVFNAQTEFTDEDHARMQTTSRADEMKTANMRHLRKKITIDLARADRQNPGPTLGPAIAKWRQWLDAHATEGTVEDFLTAHSDIRREFRQLDPGHWEALPSRRLDQQFTPIWPPSPGFTDDGSVIFRFLGSSQQTDVIAKTTNVMTGAVSRSFDLCQFAAGDRVESFLRVFFPENGKYRVVLFMGALGAQLSPIRELMYEDKAWRFTVEGVPSPKRRLCQILGDREFLPAPAPADLLRISPPGSCVRLAGLDYKFKCWVKAPKVIVNGREPEGEKKNPFIPKLVQRPADNGWNVFEGTLTCPGDGSWRAIFFVDGKVVAVQSLVTGEGSLRPTGAETLALEAQPPEIE